MAGFVSASAGLIAVIVEVNLRGWWGFATSWVDLLVILGWLGLSGWLSWWAFEGAEGWWRALALVGVVVSVLAGLVVVALLVLRLVFEYPDLLDDDSKRRRKGSRNKRRRTSSSRRHTNARGALTGVGLYVLPATAAAGMVLTGRFVDWSGAVLLLIGWGVDFGAWAVEGLGERVLGWFEQQIQ
ncbi:MAG: hypothetical protein OXG66_10965 [Acidimicrobiaceae bacterium]|nr:hypothetical protein [Acidimicrobiaceae bacterium]